MQPKWKSLVRYLHERFEEYVDKHMNQFLVQYLNQWNSDLNVKIMFNSIWIIYHIFVYLLFTV